MSFRETFPQAWQSRYGSSPDFDLPEIAPFLRHRSVRKYSDRPVSEDTVKALVAAAQSAATSSNLQLWSVISVQEPNRRARIAQLCGDQKQVETAPWFLAFFADIHRLRTAALAAGESAAGLDYEEFYAMAIIDAALAAERLVCAAESLGLSICYIGALRNDVDAVQEFFGLPLGTFGVFGLCIGFPEEDSSAEIKPRLQQESVWFRERYPESLDVREYDERMRAFYESQNMKGDATWSMRSGRRVDGNHMTGRERLKAWLERQGFHLR